MDSVVLFCSVYVLATLAEYFSWFKILQLSSEELTPPILSTLRWWSVSCRRNLNVIMWPCTVIDLMVWLQLSELSCVSPTSSGLPDRGHPAVSRSADRGCLENKATAWCSSVLAAVFAFNICKRISHIKK